MKRMKEIVCFSIASLVGVYILLVCLAALGEPQAVWLLCDMLEMCENKGCK